MARTIPKILARISIPERLGSIRRRPILGEVATIEDFVERRCFPIGPALSTVSDRDRGAGIFDGSCAQADHVRLRRRSTRRAFFRRRIPPGSAEASTYGPSLWNRRISVLDSKEFPIGQGPVRGLPSQCDLGRCVSSACFRSAGEARMAYSIHSSWDACGQRSVHRLCQHAARSRSKVLAVVLADSDAEDGSGGSC